LFFGFIIRKLRYLANSAHGQRESGNEDSEGYATKIDKKLQVNLDNLKSALGNGNDLKVHPLRFGPDNRLSGALVFIEGLADNLIVTDAILRPLKSWNMEDAAPQSKAGLLDVLEHEVLCAAYVKNVEIVPELAAGCLSGDTVLIIDGFASGLVLSSKGWEQRTVSEPQSETVVRGPREGFTEDLRTNTSLIRRKIRNGKLKVDQMT